MKKIALAATALVAGLGMAGTANAAVTLTSVQPGTVPYSGPAPTFDFNTPGTTPSFTGGAVLTTTSQTDAAPLGSTGGYYSVSPDDGPGVIALSSLGAISSLSFLWGSADFGNVVEFFNTSNQLIGTFTGNGVFGANANGSRTSPASNAVTTFSFTGADQNVGSLRMTARPGGNNPSGYSFEIDNLAISPVPEPATWAMMFIGLGLVGASARLRRRKTTVAFG